MTGQPKSPTAAQVLRARERAGLTQKQAARLVHLHRSMTWSEYERGVRPIDPARWELFLLLTQQHPHFIVNKKGRP